MVIKIVDAGYDAMIQAIREDRTPNLFVLHYSAEWMIRNLILIPRTFLIESVIEKRKPLRPLARRAGWVGCNILVNRIAADGKISIVNAGLAVPARHVREQFSRVQRLSQLPPNERGWTVEVLNLIRRLNKPTFVLQELYVFDSELKAAHPNNRNVRPKIRQQLQVLRDSWLLTFTGRGTYQLTS